VAVALREDWSDFHLAGEDGEEDYPAFRSVEGGVGVGDACLEQFAEAGPEVAVDDLVAGVRVMHHPPPG
jgi:hypothetical protein